MLSENSLDWEFLEQKEGFVVDLGDKLKATVDYIQEQNAAGAIYMGMDCPHLGVEDVMHCKEVITNRQKAYIKPACDG